MSRNGAASSRRRRSPSSELAKRVPARDVVGVGLRRIAVDERPPIKRMAHAAYLVLDLQLDGAGRDVDDVDEAVLVLVGFAAHESALAELRVGSGKISEVDLHVMAVVFRQAVASLGEAQRL